MVLLSAIGWALGKHAIPVELSYVHPRIKLPYPELCAVVMAAVGAVLLRPRFWEWDRTGTIRASAVSAVCAAVGIAVPTLVVAAGTLDLPAGTPWASTVSNVLVYAALTYLLAPLIGPGPAGGVVVILYFVVAAVKNLEPRLSSVLPVTANPDTDTHWVAVVVIAVLAVTFHWTTRGATAWTRRRSEAGR